MKKPLKILIVEDSIDDVDLIERELKKGGIHFISFIVEKKSEFENALKKFKPDVILSDHLLPNFNSIEALQSFHTYQKEFNISVPFILITGVVSEEFAVQCLKAGVDDYLLKDRLKRLPLSIQSALEKCRIETELLAHWDQVIVSQALMKEAEHLANFGSWQVDLVTGKHTWSDEMYNIYGYENPGEIEPTFEKFFNHVYADDILSLKKGFEHALANLNSYEIDFRIIDKNSNLKYIRSNQVISRNQDGEPIRLVGFNLDITEMKKAEVTLKDASREKEEILERIGDGFFAVDKKWTVTYWNAMAESHLSIRREKILGKNLWEVYAAPSAFHAQCQTSMKENVSVHFEEFYPSLSLWLEVNVYPSATGLSIYFRNITEYKKYLIEIENQNALLRERLSLNAAKFGFNTC